MKSTIRQIEVQGQSYTYSATWFDDMLSILIEAPGLISFWTDSLEDAEYKLFVSYWDEDHDR